MSSEINLDKLKKEGRLKWKSGKKKGKSLRQIIRENGKTSTKGIESILGEKAKGSKFGNKPVKADDPKNPFGINFASQGEFEFALALSNAQIEFETQVNVGQGSREYIPGVELKSHRITIDFYLPSLNLYVDFKGAITERATWQFRKVMEEFRRDFKAENRPLLCVVNSKNYQSFIILAKGGDRKELIPYLFDIKP